MDELIRRKISRTALRNHCKKLESEINGLLNDKTNDNAEKLRGLKLNLENQLKRVEKADADVFALIHNEETLADELEKSLLVQDVYFDVLSKLETYFDNKKILVKTSVPPLTPLNTSNVDYCYAEPKVKLPKIELPKFNGNIVDWPTFWDQFESAVHSQIGLSDIDKFSYLKTLLSSSAQECISGLTLSNENYKEAILLLKERFGNTQLLINAHMESFINLPRVKSMNQVSDLRNMYDQLEITVRNLKTLNVVPETYGSFLVPLLTQKLPSELTMIMSRDFKDQIWELKEMLNLFKVELEAKERCPNSTYNSKRDTHSSHSSFSTMNLHQQQKRYRNSDCAFCGMKNHSSSQCSNVTNARSRMEILRKDGKCFVCLEPGHISRYCNLEYKCNKCDKRHHISICDIDSRSISSRNFRSRETTTTVTNMNSEVGNRSKEVLLQTGKAQVTNVQNHTQSAFVRLLFDGGSQRSYVTQTLKEKLHLPVIRNEKLVVSTFGATECYPKNLDVVQLRVKSFSLYQKDVFIEALVIPTICSTLQNQQPKAVKFQYGHLQNLFISDFDDCNEKEVQILIGADFYFSFMTGKCIRGPPGCPVALESCIGWILTGPVGNHTDSYSSNLSTTQTLLTPCETRFEENMKQFWEIESLNSSDESVFNQFVNEVEHDGTRYITKLPFKPHHDMIPDNFALSKNRLLSLRKSLLKKPHLLDGYHKIFKDYENNNIIEKVASPDIAEPGSVHYLPHRAVVRENRETTKIRPVFDASSRSSGPSLNECLYAGPNLLLKIFDIILRFRTNKIAIIADIKQAFLNIAVHPDHVDFTRFLWFSSEECKEIIVYRFLRVVFGMTCSPFLLQGTIHHHCDQKVLSNEISDDFRTDFLENIYVDDILNGKDDVPSSFEFYKTAKKLMLSAGFILTKWCSNSSELEKLIKYNEEVNHADIRTKEENNDEDSITFSSFQLDADQNGCIKDDDDTLKSVLGVAWQPKLDVFIFDFSDIVKKSNTIQLTKRNILRISSSFYDPIGLISPIIIRAKIIFQLLCKLHLEWDDEIPLELRNRWHE